MTAGDVRVLLAWVGLWLLVVAIEAAWTRRAERRAIAEEQRAAALASQAIYLQRVQALRAAAALEEAAEETERLWIGRKVQAPRPPGLRLVGTDPMIADQLIHVTRVPQPRRSEK